MEKREIHISKLFTSFVFAIFLRFLILSLILPPHEKVLQTSFRKNLSFSNDHCVSLCESRVTRIRNNFLTQDGIILSRIVQVFLFSFSFFLSYYDSFRNEKYSPNYSRRIGRRTIRSFITQDILCFVTHYGNVNGDERDVHRFLFLSRAISLDQ